MLVVVFYSHRVVFFNAAIMEGVSPANMPMAASSPGAVPDFGHTATQAYITIIIITICLTLMISSVSLRIVNGFFVTHSLRWNDCELSLPEIYPPLTVEQIYVLWVRYGVSVAKKTSKT